MAPGAHSRTETEPMTRAKSQFRQTAPVAVLRHHTFQRGQVCEVGRARTGSSEPGNINEVRKRRTQPPANSSPCASMSRLSKRWGRGGRGESARGTT